MRAVLLGLVLGAAGFAAPFVWAVEKILPQAARDADVIFLGEVHDNPAHHQLQADWVRALAPVALVFEMLPSGQDQAAIAAALDDPEDLADVLDWAALGWPDFAMYYPIFAAAPDAEILGAAVPRDRARVLMKQPLAKAFGDQAARFGLDTDLPNAQQARREALQQAAHCNAMPQEMLPVMVNIQRLRDAMLAAAALRAYQDLAVRLGGPVVVITGNGHARKDWGAPALLAQAADLRLFALGQSEDGHVVQGAFDLVLDAPGVARPDPCEAFRN